MPALDPAPFSSFPFLQQHVLFPPCLPHAPSMTELSWQLVYRSLACSLPRLTWHLAPGPYGPSMNPDDQSYVEEL